MNMAIGWNQHIQLRAKKKTHFSHTDQAWLNSLYFFPIHPICHGASIKVGAVWPRVEHADCYKLACSTCGVSCLFLVYKSMLNVLSGSNGHFQPLYEKH